jgi:hypothetical protein
MSIKLWARRVWTLELSLVSISLLNLRSSSLMTLGLTLLEVVSTSAYLAFDTLIIMP